MLIILSFIEIKQLNLAQLCRLRTRINAVNFVKVVQGTSHLGAIISVKFQFFSFGGRKPPPLNRSRSNLAGKSDGPLLPAKFHLDRCSVSPLRGEKPKNRSWVKPRLWVKPIPAELTAADPAGNYTQQCNTENDNISVVMQSI